MLLLILETVQGTASADTVWRCRYSHNDIVTAYHYSTDKKAACELATYDHPGRPTAGDAWDRPYCHMHGCAATGACAARYAVTCVPPYLKVDYGYDWQDTGTTCAVPRVVRPHTGECVDPPLKQLGRCSGSAEARYGNPCDAASGNKHQTEVDIANAGPGISFVRTYNSLDTRNHGLGIGWSSNIHRHLEVNGDSIIVRQADGRGEPWTWSGDAWTGDADTRLRLTEQAAGYTITLGNGAVERYDRSGRLLAETTAAGHTTRYTYDAAGRLATVRGRFGHRMTLAYAPGSGRLDSITDGEGNAYRFDYAPFGSSYLLEKVTYPDDTTADDTDNPTRIYHYAGHHLTGITDENGDRYATFAYFRDGRASHTEHAKTTNAVPQEKFSLAYDSPVQTTVTDATGDLWINMFAENLGVRNLIAQTSHSDGKGIMQAFDTRNNLLSRADEEGRTTVYTYNISNQRHSMTEAVATAQERTTTWEYHSPQIDLVTKVSEPSVAGGWRRKRAVTVYDPQSLNPRREAIRGFRPDGTAVERVTRFAYNADHQLWRIDGARTDVDDFTTFGRHRGCATGAECGQIRFIRNALGHETTFDRYDGTGRVIRSTNPLGVVTAYDYDARGRIAAITRTPPPGQGSPRVTAYAYYGVHDQIKTVTAPDGTVVTHVYDAAHDLRSVTDSLGNRIEYRYDARGNRELEALTDPGGTLVRTMVTAYDLRNRVASIDLAGSISKTLRDAVGNIRVQIDAEQNPPTIHTPDALDRVVSTLDASGNRTRYRYDVHDRPTRIAAANGAATGYVHDDLGNLLRETSADRGTLVYTHDAAGNVATVADDRGVVVSYFYDALNRVTGVDYSGTTVEDVRASYDDCANGIGRLCQVADHSGTARYEYDVWGNVLRETRIENLTSAETFVTEYTYDAADRVATIRYPDGRVIGYHRDAVGRIEGVSSTVNGVTTEIVSDRAHRADGLVRQQRLANGLIESRQYDHRGQLVVQDLAGLHRRRYEYDLNGNLTLRSQDLSSRTYGYDVHDRLIEDDGDPIPEYDYDANGNRLRKQSRVYTYMSATNRLATDGRQGILHDAAGNRTAGTNGRRYTYYRSGRLRQYLKDGTAKGTYLYNAFGQRTRKLRDNGDVFVYHYDREGHLIAETRNGRPHKDYVWADDQPVLQAQMQVNGSGVPRETRRIYLVNDHLNTPRVGLNDSREIIWRWDGDGFGQGASDSDPDGDGDKAWVNLRFPGQYRDAESGLHYNWNRYYDPKTGRYITSDPIGLKGGLNTYLYALANPVRHFDTDGLEVRFVCRGLTGFARHTGKQHCFVHVTCPQEGWSKTFSLFGAGGLWPRKGYKAADDPRDDPNSTGNTFNRAIEPAQCYAEDCAYEKAVVRRYQSFPNGNVPYSPFGPNSNSFAQDLATGTSHGGRLPPGAPGPGLAPGINMPHPGFP